MRAFYAGCIVVLFLVCSDVAAQDIRVIDDAGTTVVLPRPAQRIISLAPHITELLFAAGAGDKIVGAIEYSDYPEQAKLIERVGNHSTIDLEKISVLKPDIIIAWQSGNPRAAIDKLQQLGYTIFQSEPKSILDIASTMQRFSELTATQQVANQAIVQFQHRYRQLQQRYKNKTPVSVFYEIWNQPMMTVNGRHLINEIIEFCGGRNVFAELDNLAPTVAVEPVLAANPQVIIASSHNGDAPQWLDDWKNWPGLDAVRYKNLFFVNWNYINRHSPRIINGIEEVCTALEKARANILNTP